MATTTTHNGSIITTAEHCGLLGLEVPSFAAPTTLLGFGPDGDLVAWGPPEDRAKVESLLRMYS